MSLLEYSVQALRLKAEEVILLCDFLESISGHSLDSHPQNDLCSAHLRCTEQRPRQEGWRQKDEGSGNCCPLPWG